MSRSLDEETLFRVTMQELSSREEEMLFNGEENLPTNWLKSRSLLFASAK